MGLGMGIDRCTSKGRELQYLACINRLQVNVAYIYIYIPDVCICISPNSHIHSILP